jgi:hypothetical protein
LPTNPVKTSGKPTNGMGAVGAQGGDPYSYFGAVPSKGGNYVPLGPDFSKFA